MNRDRAIILQIANSARLIIEFSQELDLANFSDNLLTQSAVLHQFTILGEAVERLSNEFVDQHPTIPWTEIAGMRDRLIHGYDVVNLEMVWDTIEQDVPALLQYLESYCQ